MFIYKENDIDSDKRIKNNSVEYKTHQKYKDCFKQKFPKIENSKNPLLKNKSMFKMISVLCEFLWHYL